LAFLGASFAVFATALERGVKIPAVYVKDKLIV
jgi:hypothetical protein